MEEVRKCKNNEFKNKHTSLLFVFTGGWVHDVSFSHDGEFLAWVGHDSSLSVVNATTEMQ